MKSTIFILFGVCIFQICSTAAISEEVFNVQWENYKNEFNKVYPSIEEEQFRKEIFKVNLEKINIHNEKYRNGEVTFEMGLNQFTDLTASEMKERLGFKNAPTMISENDFDAEWNYFKNKYHRMYSSTAEAQFRKEIFKKNLEKINNHNEKFRNGEVTYSMEINEFADLTTEEFKERLGFKGASAIVNKEDFDAEWNYFKNKYHRMYSSTKEEQFRKEIFRKNLEKINNHNEKFRNGEVTYAMEINEFADLTTEEFKKRFGFKGASVIVSEETLNTEWNNFKREFHRMYSSTKEEQLRKEIFRLNLEKINNHNEKYSKGEVTYEMGVNQFADLTTEEIKKRLGFKTGPDTLGEEVFNVQWENFKNEYNKMYSSTTEEGLRKEIFRVNLEKINNHNKKYQNKEVTFEMGINQFTDLTTEEFKKQSGGIISNNRAGIRMASFATNITEKSAVPDEVDWYYHGFQTEVINQAQCGSCYAQAVTGAIESHWFIKHGEFIRLSQQEIVDCSYTYGNMGCMYGDLKNTFTYIMANGIGTYDKNPYQGQPSDCRQYEPRYNISGFVQTKEEDEEDLKRAVAKGPVIAVINTGLVTFQYYKGGVYYDENCVIDPYSVNHFVLILGYGTNKDGDDYWLIKNSWGPNWGLAGYMYMARNRGNQCGIATEAMYPVL
ncbi:cystein proteinase inhibitor protein salarin-like [Condylostylus longicornis]|uniref:cystein proteinase inhibitor protein salarin-like n=1 Tax=Condylostylus longicornis TaxID=2530218 RepID=UPI00244DE5CF|nr:cystein proteinase inhibitor protein salarin-like [Condylostylus longicornis]